MNFDEISWQGLMTAMPYQQVSPALPGLVSGFSFSAVMQSFP
jgi:hypothetical protein